MIECKKHDYRYDDNCLICRKEKAQKQPVILKDDETIVKTSKIDSLIKDLNRLDRLDRQRIDIVIERLTELKKG